MQKNIMLFNILILCSIFFTGCNSISQSDYDNLSFSNKVQEETIKTLRDRNKQLEQEISIQKEQISYYENELKSIKNGPEFLINQIRNYFEDGQHKNVIITSQKLHNTHRGTNEDIEAQEILEKSIAIIAEQTKAQERIRLEEAEKAEQLKSAEEKVRQLLRIESIRTSEPNSVGEIQLRVDFKNNSEKIIKYITFEVVPYNRVGDLARCEIRDHSTFFAEAQGPYIKGEGMQPNEYWSAWYNWTIIEAKLISIDIKYMDGTSIYLSGEDVELAQY